LGWRAAECVADILSDCDAEVHTLHQLTPELALPISRADRVIFIDAGREGEPGQLSCRQVVAQLKPVRFSHELSPDGLLAMAKHMFGETCPAFLVSVCGESFSLGERLSPLVAAQMPRVVSLVAQLVRSGLSSAGSPA
jgi:hydrogenase maturation protease